MRVAVTRVLEQRGAMWVHAIHLSLPDQLKERTERAGLPLIPAWLRLHLIRLADAGDGFAEVGRPARDGPDGSVRKHRSVVVKRTPMLWGRPSAPRFA